MVWHRFLCLLTVLATLLLVLAFQQTVVKTWMSASLIYREQFVMTVAIVYFMDGFDYWCFAPHIEERDCFSRAKDEVGFIHMLDIQA